MSDTPRMDSVAELASGIVDAAILAEGMNLERELNAATSEIERLTAKVAQLYEGSEEQKQRIKRLQEAGQRVDDAAHSIQDWSGTVLGDALDELNKAKEDKP